MIGAVWREMRKPAALGMLALFMAALVLNLVPLSPDGVQRFEVVRESVGQ